MTPRTLRLVRQTHLYFGLFISPALLFFAFTGALQTFSLHETTAGSAYRPSLFLQTLGQIHKKQTWMLPPQRPRPAAKPPEVERKAGAESGPAAPASSADGKARDAATPGNAKPEGPRPASKNHLPLKIFFLLVSIGLFTSTLTGITMAYKYERGKLVITGLLLAGTLLPLLLLPF